MVRKSQRVVTPQEAAEHVRIIANAAHGFVGNKKLVFVLNLLSYADEGGHEYDPGRNYLCVAGFVAPSGEWEVFTDRWLTILTNAGLKLPFSMKDFAHRKNEFVGWTEEQRQRLLSVLIELIRATKGTPIGAVISVRDYRTLTVAQQDFLREPFHLVFQFCTRTAAIIATDEPPEESVAMFYAYNSEYGVTFGGKAEALWHKIKKEFQFGYRMKAYTSLPMEWQYAPLHAADILAYELARDFESIERRPHLSMRWPLKQLVRMFKIPKPMFMFFDRAELLRVVRDNKDHCPDQTGVLELTENADEIAITKMIDWLNVRGEYESEWPE